MYESVTRGRLPALLRFTLSGKILKLWNLQITVSFHDNSKDPKLYQCVFNRILGGTGFSLALSRLVCSVKCFVNLTSL